MRTKVNIEMIKQRTIAGQLAKIEKRKVQDAQERVRAPELAQEKETSLEQRPKTLAGLIHQR